MKNKKLLEEQTRGWLPKEPVFPSPSTPQQVMPEAKDAKQKGEKYIGRIIFVTILTGGILLGIFSAMGFGFYSAIPIGVAISLVVAVAERRVDLPKDALNAQRKTVKVMTIANLAIGGIFASFIFLRPVIKNDEVTLACVIALVVSWFLVNRLLLRNLPKQTTISKEKKA